MNLFHNHNRNMALQSPDGRPTFDDIKTELAETANQAFNCSPERAQQTKRAKQQALLGQMLPAKVGPWVMQDIAESS